jgi:hypothetical protein
MSTTYANVTIQDLEFTEKSLGLNVKITYVSDRVGAGASIETHDEGEHTIEVHMDPALTTAAEIKAAVEAHPQANSWVAVTVTGSASNVQLSVVEAPLAGGAAVATASASFGPILFTAIASGTAGNSVRVQYADAEAIDVTVAGNDITVSFIDGVSTANEVAAAVNADVEANLLVTAKSDDHIPMLVVHGASLTALSGGAAAVAPSVEVQDLTFASDTTGTSDSGSTISYTTGATAGSEVVSVSSQDINVQIENGVSTATQIKAAFDASTAANGTKAAGTATVVSYAALAPVAAVAATGSITYGVPVANDTVIVNGTTFTYVAAAPGAGEFSTIGELEALVEAVTGVNSSENGTVVSITAAAAGVAGNAITLARAGTGTLAVSGATLTGGAEAIAGKSVTVAGHALVAGVDFTAETNNDTTAENLKDAIHALTEVNATRTDNIVSVVAANIGVAGNAIAMTTTGGAALTLSGASLSGGLDGWECTVSGTGSTAQVTVNEAATSGAIAPSGTSFLMTEAERTIKENYFVYQFGFIPSRLRIKNTDPSGENILVISYDGVNPAVALAAGQELLLDSAGISIPHAVALKYTTGAPAYVIEASAIGPNLSDPTAPEED